MAATDDPLFLGFEAPEGREFRLLRPRGSQLRRGAEDLFVLAGADDPITNVAQPALNDPTRPPLDAGTLAYAYLRKGLEPIPNVRGRGELDDRLAIEEVAVEVFAEGLAAPLRFARAGPLWLGLVSGMRIGIPRVDAGA